MFIFLQENVGTTGRCFINSLQINQCSNEGIELVLHDSIGSIKNGNQEILFSGKIVFMWCVVENSLLT